MSQHYCPINKNYVDHKYIVPFDSFKFIYSFLLVVMAILAVIIVIWIFNFLFNGLRIFYGSKIIFFEPNSLGFSI